jgi:hypothetical protein
VRSVKVKQTSSSNQSESCTAKSSGASSSMPQRARGGAPKNGAGIGPCAKEKTVDENKEVALREGEYLGSNLPVTRADFEALSDQRKMLLEFVAKQLRKDVDYGVIPGTPKSSLFKPGAEKLARLFGLGIKLNLSDKTIDKAQNFAMFTYKAEIVHLKSGQMIAECEASCNSQEKKYKERAVWINNKKEKEITPIFDILNTLQKMAQKRAMVGGVILAVGASDFFTQDIDDVEDSNSIGAAPQARDVSSSVPNVTKVSSEIHQPHSQGTANGVVLVEAVGDTKSNVELRDAIKASGFKWDKVSFRWTKFATEAERASLSFETRVIGA